MSNYCCTIKRFLHEGCIKNLVDNRGFDIRNIFTYQDGFILLNDLLYHDILEECEEEMHKISGFEMKSENKKFDVA